MGSILVKVPIIVQLLVLEINRILTSQLLVIRALHLQVDSILAKIKTKIQEVLI